MDLNSRQYHVHVGSSSFLRDEGVNIDLDDEYDEMNAFVAVNKILVGRFIFRETLRPECKDVIQRLQNRNIRVAVLTGDRRRSARINFEAAMKTSLDEWHVCLPHEKAYHVRKWQKQGHVVAVVGDGVNDAAAMVCADVGVGIGADAFVTGCADITIVGDKFDRNVRYCVFLNSFTLSKYITSNTGTSRYRSIHTHLTSSLPSRNTRCYVRFRCISSHNAHVGIRFIRWLRKRVSVRCVLDSRIS